MRESLLDAEDSRDALETYLHEYRYARQHYEVAKLHGALAHEVDSMRAADIEHSLDGYVPPEDDEHAYWDQLAERDAREFAETYTDSCNSVAPSRIPAALECSSRPSAEMLM